MAQWFLEEGIGETRAIRLADGEIVEARVEWPGELSAGSVAEGRLVSRERRGARGVAMLAGGVRVLCDRVPAGLTEGAAVCVVITRPAMAEAERGKLARGRLTDEAPRPAPPLAERLAAEGHTVVRVTRFSGGDWNALMAEAFSGEIAFAGGALLLSPTPAMTLVDVDGELPAPRLALAACAPIARALARLDIAGSIGIDFPTLSEKAARRAVDGALDAALQPWPHERTAMNGFGFVQLVARLERPSILHRAQLNRAATAARLLLRRAEGLEGAGTIELACHPALAAQLRPEWLDALRRRTGRDNRLRIEPGLALEAPQAQLVPR